MRKLTIVLVLGVLATFGTAEAKSVAVDCNDGKTIGKALEMNAGILEIVVSGDCAENVLIERDDVSIVAQAGSTLTATDDTVAAIVVQGAQNVSVTGLSISGGRHGVEVRRGAAVTLTAVTVNDNVRHGVLVIDHSSVNIAGGTFSGNGGDGLGVWAASSATMGGSIVADGNTRAGILVSGSSVAAIPPGSISLQNNGYGGLYLQLSANVQLSVPLDQAGSDEGIAVYLGSSLAMGAFETSGNGFSGVTVYHNSTFESNGGTVTVDGNLHGFWVEEDSSLVRTGTTNFLSNTDAALYAEDSNVRLRNANWQREWRRLHREELLGAHREQQSGRPGRPLVRHEDRGRRELELHRRELRRDRDQPVRPPLRLRGVLVPGTFRPVRTASPARDPGQVARRGASRAVKPGSPDAVSLALAGETGPRRSPRESRDSSRHGWF